MKILLVIFVFIGLKIWEVIRFFGMGIYHLFEALVKRWIMIWYLGISALLIYISVKLTDYWIDIGFLNVKTFGNEHLTYMIVSALLVGLCFSVYMIIDILKLYISDIKKFVAGNWRQAQQIVDIKIYKENEKNGRI